MSLALIFWVLMLLWVVAGLWWHLAANVATPPFVYAPLGLHLFLFILLLLLGWGIFGAPIR
jgi:hypothetical protein